MSAKIYRDKYKGKDCIVMESKRLRACFVSTGSRMVSLIDKKFDREFLYQGKNREYITGCYDEAFPGIDLGFDEMFPSIDECYYESYPWKGIRIPDHGEVWSLEWDCGINPDHSLEMGVHGVRFPYRLDKRISFRQDNILRMDYRAYNLSQFDMDFLWAAHPMMRAEENSCVMLPPECRTGFCSCDDDGRLGSFGTLFDVAEKTGFIDPDGNIVHSVRGKSFKSTEKYYIQGRLKNGKCGLRYPLDETAIMLNFPVDTVPYLGVLVADGGIDKEGCTVILEPCSAPYDRPDRAKAFTCGSVLKAKSSCEWYLEFELINIDERNGKKE